MVVRPGIGEAKADWNHVEERWVGYRYAPAAEIVAGVEDELEPAGARLIGAHQRRGGAAVGVGHDIGDEVVVSCAPQFIELHSDAVRRLATGYVEDVGGDAGQILLPCPNKRPAIERVKRSLLDGPIHGQRVVAPCAAGMAAALPVAIAKRAGA
jgi:hypothetical protein